MFFFRNKEITFTSRLTANYFVGSSVMNSNFWAKVRDHYNKGFDFSAVIASKSVKRITIIMISPLEQFEVNKNISYFSGSNGIGYNDQYAVGDVSLIYSKLWDFFGFSSIHEVVFYNVFFISCFFFFYIKGIKIYPYSWIQVVIEFFVFQIREFATKNSGFGNQPMTICFGFVVTSLLIFNVFGMIPFAFTITSHFIATFFYSFSLFFGINWIAITRHGKNFFNIFLPQGTPTVLLPLLVGLEFISYFSRLFSLSIRLFANIMAGHTLLNIFTSFAFKAIELGGISFIVSFFGFFILFSVIFMEVAIAFLQVFVFITLISLYVVDVHSVNH